MPADGVLSRRELTAAYWVSRVLFSGGLRRDRIRDSYRSLPLAGRLDYSDLEDAQEVLLALGLVIENDGALEQSPELRTISELHEEAALEPLLAATLEAAPPLWLRAATGGDAIRDELIPDQAADALRGLLGDPERREAFLLARSRKVEADERAAIGNIGEEAVVMQAQVELVALGRADLADRVHQVSLVSDELGYDVTAPRIDGEVRRMEVKTTRLATSSVTVFLSRTEAAVGAADPLWSLVICELDQNGAPSVVGWLPASAIVPVLPVNAHANGTWESARLRLETSALTAGLPPI